MSHQAVNMISNRLSLRSPQRDSLEILRRICEIASLGKGGDVAQAMATEVWGHTYYLILCE